MICFRSDGIANFTPPVKIAIDASADPRRAAYVAIIVDEGHKPRLVYGTGYHVGCGYAEAWGINRVLRRVNTRYAGRRPLLVFTDNLGITQSRGNVHVQYRWLPRSNRLMQHLHRAANALRKSLPPTPPDSE